MLNLKVIIDAIDRWVDLVRTKDFQKVPIDQKVSEALADFAKSVNVEELYKELSRREAEIRETTQIRLPLGLVVLAGPGSSGKSTYLRQLFASYGGEEAFHFVSMGEVGSLTPFDIKQTIAEASNTDKVVLVDSWKDIWNDWHFSNSALQTGGIYTSLTAFLGLLSQSLFLAGKTMIVVFNPQTAGERETVYQMLNSQSSGMIRLSGTQAGKVDYAQGRSIDPEQADFARNAGIKVIREPIFEDASAAQASDFGNFFTKPII